MEYEGIRELDFNEATGETLYEVRVVTGELVSCIICEDGTELFTSDWQAEQPKSFDEVPEWRWVGSDELISQ